MLASFLTTIEAAAALHLHPATCTPWLQRENSWMEGFTPDDPPCRAFSGKIDLRTVELGCNTAVDAGLYTFTFAKTGAKVSGRYTYTYTYRWNGSEWLITSHHSSAMPEK
jgi:hypothetical protein